MPKIFRSGSTYATVEHAKYLGYIYIEGEETHITRRCNVDNTLKCQRMLEQLTGKGDWKWVA